MEKSLVPAGITDSLHHYNYLMTNCRHIIGKITSFALSQHWRSYFFYELPAAYDSEQHMIVDKYTVEQGIAQYFSNISAVFRTKKSGKY